MDKNSKVSEPTPLTPEPNNLDEATIPEVKKDTNTPLEFPKLETPSMVEPEIPEEYEDAPVQTLEMKTMSKWQRFRHWVGAHKKLTIAIVVALLLLPVLIIALTDLRYGVMNLFTKASVTVVALDDMARPISGAEVSLGDITAKTDGSGQAKLEGSLYGAQTLKIYKEGYRPLSEALKVESSPLEKKYSLEITGIRFNAMITDVLSGKPLKGVKLTYQNSDATSDEAGKATLVVPPGTGKITATASLSNYNKSSLALEKGKTATLNLTPAGKIYFLSKRSGKIDVMSANLDGSDQKVVVAGTGNEQDASTSLLATRDWKYLALKAKRDNAEKLYLISTASNNTLTTIDTSPGAQFNLHGWSGSTLVYTADNLKNNYEIAGNQALKGFNASTGRSFSYDESRVEDALPFKVVRSLSEPQIVLGNLIYARTWNTNDTQYTQEIVTSSVDGQKKVLTTKPSTEVTSYVFVSYASGEVWVGEYLRNGESALYEYEQGKLEKLNGETASKVYEPYPIYLLSPDGKRELVDEERDGKHVISIRDVGKEEGTRVLDMSDYQIFGWYGSYLLLSKNGSELYTLDPASIKSPKEPTKIGSYHKPQITYRGYGYGYGGN